MVSAGSHVVHADRERVRRPVSAPFLPPPLPDDQFVHAVQVEVLGLQ